MWFEDTAMNAVVEALDDVGRLLGASTETLPRVIPLALRADVLMGHVMSWLAVAPDASEVASTARDVDALRSELRALRRVWIGA